MPYILSIDQGTSGTKAVLFDETGSLVHRHNENHGQFYPQPGWVEHDPVEIFEKTCQAVDACIKEAGVSPAGVKAVSISNQRETVVVWDRRTGQPVYPAVVWQCSRAENICRELDTPGVRKMVLEKTGLVLSPYFSAAKVKWILDYVEGAREAAEAGWLMAGTIDSWLIYKLTGGRVHATEPSNASRTQLYNIHKRCWDRELLELFTIPGSMMPEVMPSDSIFGPLAVTCLADQSTPLAGVLGDSQAALFGQQCTRPGMTKVTYGTGSSIMRNIGAKPYISREGLVTSVGWQLGDDLTYVAEGNINCSGAAIKWLVDDLELIPDSKCTEAMAAGVKDTEGVYLVPAFVGLGAPYWDSDARAALVGMTRGTKKAHVVRAVLESMVYQVRDILDLMQEESGTPTEEIRVDGGPTRNSFLMQFQSDISRIPVVVNELEELSAIGAAYMGGLSAGVWPDMDTLCSLRTKDTRFLPDMAEQRREQLYHGWKAAVAKVLTK